MITTREALVLADVVERANDREVEVDAKIREMLRAKGSVASLSGLDRLVAEELQERYQRAGWQVTIADVGGDRVTSPDDWKITLTLVRSAPSKVKT